MVGRMINTIMKSNKKLAFIGALAVGMLLAACGSSGENTPASSSKKPGGNTGNQPTVSSSIDYSDKADFELTINGETKAVKESMPLEKPADPAAPAGKKFYGWKNTLNGGQIWDFENPNLNYVLGNINLEPCFVDANQEAQILEAELCPNINATYDGEKGMPGATYSGGQAGKGLIGRDWDEVLGCTGEEYMQDGEPTKVGAYVHFLYVKGDKLTWEFESDADATDVTIFGRYSAEYGVEDDLGYRGYKVNDESFPITVNGEKQKYGEVKLTLPVGADTNGGSFTPFQDYLVSQTVTLKKGTNIIEMTVDNTDTVNGTIASSAPVVDSIKVFSSSKITWNKKVLDNMVRE